MTRNRWAAYACMSALTAGALGVLAPPASAAAVTPADAATALDLPAGVTAAVAGSSVVGTQSFDDFPAAGSSYLALSTGDADQIFTAAHDAQLSTDRGAVGSADDASTLTLTVQPGAGVGCLYVDFAMATEERVHYYTADSPGDTLSVKATGDATEYAENAGDAYFTQVGWDRIGPVDYTVNAVQFWHQPGDPSDPVPGQYGPEEPGRLPQITALNSVTTKDTARVPLTFTGGQPATVTVSIGDVNNADLDSVAFVDHVRTSAACVGGTGVEPNPSNDGGLIRGVKAVGQELTYDPVPSTAAIETDPAATGWRSPSVGAPVELRFRWYRTITSYALDGDMNHWTPIPDADRQSYVPTAADYGKVLIVLVTGLVDGRYAATFPSTNDTGSPTWFVTTKIATGTFIGGSQPTINGPGAPKVGDTLTAAVGDAFPRQDSWAWQWYAAGSPISGANSSTLILSDNEAGKSITVRATAKRLDFTDRAWTSAAYGPVAYNSWTSTGVPTLVTDGTPTVGEVVSVATGDGWSPTPDSFTYQWKRNGAAIGATTGTYTLRSSDAGAQISVSVTPVKPGYGPVSQTTSAVAVAGTAMTTATPTISGPLRVGQTLTGSVVGWESGASLTYTWYAGTTVLQTGYRTYLKLPATAAGKHVKLRITGKKTGYSTTSADSLPTAAVAKGVLTSAKPSIAGVARVGQTVYVAKGYWGPTGVRYTYQWRVNGAAVSSAAGRGTSFKIPRSARGKRITVVLTGRLAGYNTVSRTSAATKRVAR